jgi:hypothetical protein
MSKQTPNNSSQARLAGVMTLKLPDRQVLRQLPRTVRRSGGWFTIGLGSVALLAWNAPLICATGAGIGTMWAVYTVKELGSGRAAWAELQQTLQRLPPKFLISVLSGLGATLGTAGMFAVWQGSDSPGMAAGTIVQGLVTTGILGFLIWQRTQQVSSPVKPTETAGGFDDWLMALHSAEPLRRIMAIHQLYRQVDLNPDRQMEVLDYLCYIQAQDGDGQVRDVAGQTVRQLRGVLGAGSFEPMGAFQASSSFCEGDRWSGNSAPCQVAKQK